MGKELLGAHWNDTTHTKAYQLYRRVETVARQLEQRRKRGWVATKDYIAELRDIALQLQVLDKSVRQKAHQGGEWDEIERGA